MRLVAPPDRRGVIVTPAGRVFVARKLTAAQAGEIRRRRAAGESGSALAGEFNINQATVCDIHRGRTWRWL